MPIAKLRSAIKLAINQNSIKWKASKVYEIEVSQSYHNEERKEGWMTITVKVRRKKK